MFAAFGLICVAVVCVYHQTVALAVPVESTNEGVKYLILTYAHEGMSKWKDIMITFFRLAVKYERTAVLPCFLDSHMSNCELENSVPVSMVIDIKYIVKQIRGLKTITFQDYNLARKVTTMLQCVNVLHSLYKKQINGSLVAAPSNLMLNTLQTLSSDKHIIHKFDFQQYESCIRDFNETESVSLFFPWFDTMIEGKHKATTKGKLES